MAFGKWSILCKYSADLKAARKVLRLSRRALAEMVNIDPRYLANIENSGSLPSPPVFYQLVKICKLPVERYFSRWTLGGTTRSVNGRPTN